MQKRKKPKKKRTDVQSMVFTNEDLKVLIKEFDAHWSAMQQLTKMMKKKQK